MSGIPSKLKTPLVDLLLSVADDKFLLGHRNADWTGLAPILEEDIAFSSLAQDELAHASALYEFAGRILERGADALAYGRQPSEYRCAAIVELADEFDWALAICRQFFCDHHDLLRLSRLARSSLAPLAALGSRLLAEERIHVGHADSWVSRLGQGGDDARQRMQKALDTLSPLAPMLFEPTIEVEKLESAGFYPPADEDMFAAWSGALGNVAHEAGLRLALRPPRPDALGGRRGRHHEGFAALLEELTEVYRLEPQGQW